MYVCVCLYTYIYIFFHIILITVRIYRYHLNSLRRPTAPRCVCSFISDTFYRPTMTIFGRGSIQTCTSPCRATVQKKSGAQKTTKCFLNIPTIKIVNIKVNILDPNQNQYISLKLIVAPESSWFGRFPFHFGFRPIFRC